MLSIEEIVFSVYSIARIAGIKMCQAYRKLYYSDYEQVNVGCGEELAIQGVAEIIAEILGYQGTIGNDLTKPDGVPRKLLDITNIKRLGWTPKTPLRAGIQTADEDFCTENGQKIIQALLYCGMGLSTL